MALWSIDYETAEGARDCIWIHAADARTMKRAALNAASKNARKRGKERLKRRGIKARVVGARCIG